MMGLGSRIERLCFSIRSNYFLLFRVQIFTRKFKFLWLEVSSLKIFAHFNFFVGWSG